ncbi:alpha/beta hydrolase, partial [Actinomyces bowdenii]|uniref:alpha/beta hydrolase n=1 Tax=Actinomyces bowdenii TaxID=131109 RepID=UPI001FD0784D
MLDNSGDHVRATHHGDPHLDASGHSYGSVVNGLALQQTDVADELEVHGSPGTGSADASDMGLLPDHMAEASAAKDTVAFSGAHGRPPQ